MYPIIGFLSACGGAGASTLAALTAASASVSGPTVLLDCDPLGGGIDMVLGCEATPGPRWRQVRTGGGTLAPDVLLAALPRWGRVSFLAADSPGPLAPETLAAVLTAASHIGPVVLDLPRWPAPVREVALEWCRRVVLVTTAQARAVTAGAMVARGLDHPGTVVAVRGSGTTPHRVAGLLGVRSIGAVPHDHGIARGGPLAPAARRPRFAAVTRAILRESAGDGSTSTGRVA